MDTNGTVPNFDYSCEITSNYFKSSFARSMAFSNSNQSKSLDYVYFDRATINEECETDNQKLTADDSSVGIKAFSPQPPRSYGSPTINNHQLFTSPDFGKINGRNGNKTNDALKLWNMKKETLKREEESKENNHFHLQNNHQQIEDNCSELIRLRKECQSLMEENRRLQLLDKRPSPAHSPTTSIDISYLQSQVDTLQWQLKQAESSRQMYRAVLEQVSRFLERVHKNLDQVNGVKPCNSKGKASSRVPRSRSVHTVATTPSSSPCSSSHSRPSSPSPSPSPSYVHRASSIAQMQESHSYATLRDHWRGPRNSVVEDVPVEKLSQEAFRMLRTVQSLLGTREPDLAHRLTPTPTPATSISETLNDSGSERRDSTSVGSCSSLLQSSCGGLRKSIDCASSINSIGSSSRGATTQLSGDADEVEVLRGKSSSSSSSPPLHLTSTEDESGFSSMSSFHEVGLPDCSGRVGYPELGLPLVEPPNHRRWSSTPVDTHFHAGEAIRVLWV